MKSNKKLKQDSNKTKNSKSSNNNNIRIMVKCSWSGARLIPTPSPTSSNNTNRSDTASDTTSDNKSVTHSGYNSKTKLSEIISDLSHLLPPIITNTSTTTINTTNNDTQPFIVYMRTSTYKRDWDITTIGHLLTGSADDSSIMLTLNLPKDSSSSTTGKGIGIGDDVVMTTTTMVTTNTTETNNNNHATMDMGIEPMDIDMDNNNNNNNNNNIQPTNANASSQSSSPQEAIQKILSSNFDSSSITFFKTILKIISNILSTPKLTPQQFYQYNHGTITLTSTNSIIGKSIKVRMLKLNNQYIQRNIVQMNYGLEFLLHVIGFSYQLDKTITSLTTIGFDFDHTTTSRSKNENSTCEIIELKPEEEDTMKLQSIYHEIIHVLVHDLNISKHDLPSLPTSIPSSSSQQQEDVAVVSTFNPYKSQSYNVQTATTKQKPSSSSSSSTSTNPNITATERQVEILKQKEKSIQQSIQYQFHSIEQRNIRAFLPSDEKHIVSLSSSSSSSNTTNNKNDDDNDKHDASLIATQIKKLQQSTSSSNNTFQTKAMREMNKLKSKKVYTHSILKIYFPDGTRLDIQFVPNEKVNDVKDVIHNCFIDDCCDNDGGRESGRRMVKSDYDFELYISPPKRILKDDLTLEEEGLVPAAKVFISWKKNVGGGGGGGGEQRPGWYIQHQYFQSKVTFGSGSSAGDSNDTKGVPSSLFPVSKSITKDNNEDDKKKKMTTKKEIDENNGKNSLASKEEMMMKRMMGMGGGKAILRKVNIVGGSHDKDNDKSSGGSSNHKSGDNNGSGGSNRPKWFKG